jgi:hypothetical protein
MFREFFHRLAYIALSEKMVRNSGRRALEKMEYNTVPGFEELPEFNRDYYILSSCSLLLYL